MATAETGSAGSAYRAGEAAKPIVELRNVGKTFFRGKEPLAVLEDINLDIPEGAYEALMGPSGSGKSTLLNLIAGLDRPTKGTAIVAGNNLSTMSDGDLARFRSRTMGFIFQAYNLMPVLTALENVELPLLLTNLSKAERKKRSQTALRVVGLEERMGHFPRQLSGGQEQRVGIARAIVTEAAEQCARTALPELAEPAATFVTLTQQGQLRGCIGSLEAYRPLATDVAENAVAAAFRDPRFPPLNSGELARTRVEVSLLTPAQAMSFSSEADALAQLRPEIDGVIFSASGRRSTFLPQVWEQLPDPSVFMARLKQKAGLPAGYLDQHMQAETRNYVPNILATIIIAKNPEKYGFTSKPEAPLTYDYVKVNNMTDLRLVADATDTPYDYLLALNPELKRGVTPPGVEHLLRVPTGKGRVLQTALQRIPVEKRASWRMLTAQASDDFDSISRKTGVSAAAIEQVNGGAMKPGQKVIIPAGGNVRNVVFTAKGVPAASSGSTSSVAGGAAKIIAYKVKAGESLGDIAGRYNTSVRDIATLNRLGSAARLRAGQVIKVPVRSGR